jgi:peroxisomal 2,4-dienoyl-CoA reductase
MTFNSPFKPDCLSGRVAITTGGGSGIGLGIATCLGEHGCKLVLMGRREAFLLDAKKVLQGKGIQVEIFAGDVRSEKDAQQAVKFAVEKFGRLDVLVNCAAGNFLSLAEDLTVKGFTTVLEIDTIGTFNMCRQAFPALRDSGNGVIINISATLHYTSTWYQTHACAAKAAIDSMTRNLALEWGTYGCRVNGIAPGPIADTPGFEKLTGTQDTKQQLKERVPLGRAGTTSEIGQAAVFLCSNAAQYVTGQTLIVDGGAWLWTPPNAPRNQVAEMSRGVEEKSRKVGRAKI